MAALCVIAAAACSSGSNHGRAQTLPSTTVGPGPASSTAPRAATNLDCSSPIGRSPEPPAGYEEVAGAVALATSTSGASALQTSASGRADPDARLFAKTGLLVKTGARADIIVPPAWVGRLAVEWGNTTRRALTHHLIVGPCPGDDPWIAFPGGFYVPQPACVELIVRVANIDHEVSVGVGAPCPGQKPPPQPTER